MEETPESINGDVDLSTVPRSRTEADKHTVLNRAMTTWNSLPPQVTQTSNKTRYKPDKRTPYGTTGTEETQTFSAFCIMYCFMYVIRGWDMTVICGCLAWLS
jgi:hypothetical protein